MNSWTSIKKKTRVFFALWFLQSFLTADFKENQLFTGFQDPYQKSAKQENSSLFMNGIL